MIKLCDKHQIVYDTGKWLYCPVCEDYKEIERHERENERLRKLLSEHSTITGQERMPGGP